jgi:hypothetical protein
MGFVSEVRALDGGGVDLDEQRVCDAISRAVEGRSLVETALHTRRGSSSLGSTARPRRNSSNPSSKFRVVMAPMNGTW